MGLPQLSIRGAGQEDRSSGLKGLKGLKGKLPAKKTVRDFGLSLHEGESVVTVASKDFYFPHSGRADFIGYQMI